MIGSVVRRAAVAAVAAIVLASACVERPSTDSAAGDADASVQDATGTVGAELTLPGGEHLSTVSYTLTNGTYTYTGTIDVSGSSTASFVVGGVPSGSGYLLKLTAVSDDMTVGCSGTSTPFSVSNRATTMVLVQLVCIVQHEAGGIIIGGTPSNCAVWNTIVANPSQAAPGASTTLNAAATAPAPGAITFTWTVVSGNGTISNNTSAITANDAGATDTATFTCPATPEIDTIQLVVGDGPLPDGGSCPTVDTTGNVQVTCGQAPCQNPLIGSGVPATPDTATGTCPSGQYNPGNLQDANGNFCCTFAPPCLIGTMTAATPNTATGTCPAGQINIGQDSLGNYCCGFPCSQSTLVPCTGPNQTCCVPCGGSANGYCTPTEALLVAHDIANAKVTPDAGEGPGDCYSCLWNAGCLDDTNFHDINHECGDLTGAFNVGPAAGSADSTLCLDTLSCILRTSCASGGNAAGCYCGSLASATCASTLPGAINGPCTIQEIDGLNPAPLSPPALPTFTDPSTPSGRANSLVACATANSCTSCLTNGSGATPGCPTLLTTPSGGFTVTATGGSAQIVVDLNSAAPIPAVWSAFAGTLSNEQQNGSSLKATFTCPATSSGPIPVTVIVNGGPRAGCPTTDNALTLQVLCPATSDAGADATVDASPACDASALVPCTMAGQTCCVACAGSTNGICTQTEAMIVAHDIANGHATLAGEATDGCYACLYNGGCIDDTLGDVGHECGDLPNLGFDAGAKAGTNEQNLCLNTLSCLLAPPSCASQSVGVCYCGTAGVATTCQGNPAPGPINGTCAQVIADGLGYPPSDGTDITKHLTDTTKPAGVADQIFQCALSNVCTTCMQ
jgi:hypothetical protein